jgi:hypothetical protein
MDKGTPNGETVVIEPIKNDAQTQVIEPNTELIEARKRAEQAEMRARQLENEKKEREKQDEIARQKQLEENEEYKILYEREKEAKEALETEREREESQRTISSTKGSILASYDSEVVDLAESTGIDLYDDSEESKIAFTAKLDKIASKLKLPEKKVIGNNPPIIPTNTDDSKVLMGRLRYDDRDLRESAKRTIIGSLPGVEQMRKIADSPIL